MNRISLIALFATLSIYSFAQDPATIRHGDMKPSYRVSTNAWETVKGKLETRIAPIETTVQGLRANVSGSNVYYQVKNPLEPHEKRSLSLHEIVDGTDVIIWDEKTQHEQTKAYVADVVTNVVMASLDAAPDRAWGLYTSGTGAAAPENTTYISTKHTVFAGEYEYRKLLTANGSVQILCANNFETSIETNGSFNVINAAGRTLMSFHSNTNLIAKVKIDDCAMGEDNSFIVGVMKHQGGIVIQNHPTAICADTITGPWYRETDSACPYRVTWSLSNGQWLGVFQRKNSSSNTGFVKFSVPNESGANDEALFNVPVRPSGGILCTDGIHVIYPVYNNGNIQWQVR